MSRRRQKAKRYTFYNELTEPMLPMITAPIPRYLLPRESALRRTTRGIGAFFAAIIITINTLLAFILVIGLLLLFTRFILNCAHLTLGQYSDWLMLLSNPLVHPFEKYLPTFMIAHYTIDLPTLAVMLVYLTGALLVRKFLKMLVRS